MSHYLTLKKIGQAVAYYPNLTKKLGNVNASILLSQFIYWHDKTEHPLGVYKTQDEIKAETGLSRKEQETGRKVLRELGLITETYKRTEHKLYFLFHPEAFDEWFENEAMPESDIRECKKVTLPMPESDIPPMPESDIRYIHKSTNENTQESHAPAQNSEIDLSTEKPTAIETFEFLKQSLVFGSEFGVISEREPNLSEINALVTEVDCFWSNKHLTKKQLLGKILGSVNRLSTTDRLSKYTTEKQAVRHRIDGLENYALSATFIHLVRHRIDGLEIVKVTFGIMGQVRHRIDGLEN